MGIRICVSINSIHTINMDNHHNEKRRYAWEFLYLVGIYFQFICTSATILINEAYYNRNPSSGALRNAVLAFISLATIFAWFTIVSSLFQRTRKFAIPFLVLNTLCFCVALSVTTSLQKDYMHIPINTFWQLRVGWAGFAIQVVCCISAKRFWDGNASEDQYSSTGYFGNLPVFPISRAAIYVATFFQMMGVLGFILPWSPVKWFIGRCLLRKLVNFKDF